jgi:predicted lipid-binding transport protein (Tim44 family)
MDHHIMGGGGILLEIIIFAVVAGILAYRLRNALGQRHGEERQRPNPLAPPYQRRDGEQVDSSADDAVPDNVIALPNRRDGRDEGPISLAESLRRITALDARFDEKSFLHGAKAAFEMILRAFAAGDLAALCPLLDNAVYERFEAAIRQRQEAGEILDSDFYGFVTADLIDARLMANSMAVCTVCFVTRQTHVTRDAAGTTLAGDPRLQEEVTDIWTFARDMRSKDPNWKLIETKTPAE